MITKHLRSNTAPGDIYLDLDRDRIRTVLKEAYNSCRDMLDGKDFSITVEQFVGSIEPYLSCNRVTIPVTLSLPSKDYRDLKIEVDLRRQKVMAKGPYKKIQATLNYFLRQL